VSDGIVRDCEFCGSMQFGINRCSGCGAAPVRTATKPKSQFNKIENTRAHAARVGSNKYLTCATAVLAIIAVSWISFALTPSKLSDRIPVSLTLVASDNVTSDRVASNSGWYQPVTTIRPPRYSEAQIRKLLRSAAPATHHLHYVGINRSTDPSGAVHLNLVHSKQPVVLVLSSYQPVSWVIDNSHNNEIAAIVYGSHHPGSSVSGKISEDTKLFNAENRIGDLTVAQSCHCVTSGVFQCTGSSVTDTVEILQNLSSNGLIGISNGESVVKIDVPQRYIDTGFWIEVKKNRDHTAERELACLS